MTLQQKILAALAKSTSRSPLDTEHVREAVGTPRMVFKMLGELRDQLKVGHCRITKGDAAVDWWWLAGNIPSEGHSCRGKKK